MPNRHIPLFWTIIYGICAGALAGLIAGSVTLINMLLFDMGNSTGRLLLVPACTLYCAVIGGAIGLGGGLLLKFMSIDENLPKIGMAVGFFTAMFLFLVAGGSAFEVGADGLFIGCLVGGPIGGWFGGWKLSNRMGRGFGALDTLGQAAQAAG